MKKAPNPHYTPYVRDMNDKKRREKERTSNTNKLGWIIGWAIAIAIFV